MFLPAGTLPRSDRRSSLLSLSAVLIVIAAGLFFVTPAHAAVSTDSLVGYWKFDEGTGTLAADSSGHGNNGTLTSGPTWTTTKPTLNFTKTADAERSEDWGDAILPP